MKFGKKNLKLGFGQDFEVEAFESDLLVRALSVPQTKI